MAGQRGCFARTNIARESPYTKADGLGEANLSVTTAASHSARLCEQGPVRRGPSTKHSAAEMLFSGTTYPPPSRDPWTLGRATHAILGGEKLLWGEAGLGGVSPEISQRTGQKLCVSVGSLGSSPLPASLWPPRQLRIRIDRLWGLRALASENRRVWSSWVSCRIGGPHFQD